MKKIGSIRGIEAIVLDIDNTMYERRENYLTEGTQREIFAVGNILGYSLEETANLISKKKKLLAEKSLNNNVTMTEIVYSLGISTEQWSVLRIKAWQPENWIGLDEKITEAIAKLKKKYVVAFGTNSPTEVGKKIIRIIGINKELIPDEFIFGPEKLNWKSKPDLEFFRLIAKKIGVCPGKCISIGDREFSDGPPAIKAGYAGAIIVNGSQNELLTTVNLLL